MHSLRRSLTSYLLALLVITLAVVGVVIDQVTGRSLAARQASSSALLDAQFDERCREERQRVDEELLQAARKFGVEMQKEYPQRVQEDYPRFNAIRIMLAFGHGQPWGTTAFFGNSAVYSRYAREYFAPLHEELLRRVENPDRDPDYYEIFSPWWRSGWRSESLGEDSLSTLRVDDWTFDDTLLSPSLEPVRRVVLRVPRQFSPFPQRRSRSSSSLPGPDGPPRPAPDLPPRPGFGPGLGGPRPTFPFFSSFFSWATPSDTIYVQVARPTAAIEDRIDLFLKDRDEEAAKIATQIADERRKLRTQLLIIGFITFLCIAIGGPLLVGAGLRPLRDLSTAVSQVSEKDFKLPHNGEGLPSELAGIHGRLTQTLDMLSRAFAREKQAVADISHELRTPIASLQATLDVALRKPRTPEQYRNTLDECRLINKQLAQLVERIMTLATLDAGNDHVEMIRTDASEIAAGCAAVIRPLAVSHSLSLNVDVDAPLELDTDPDKLREVLMNLLHNAVEYNQPDGRVDLTAHRENGSVVFEIKDSGIGMPPEVRDRIFERFFRADASRHATGVHAGLGLAIVHEYVNRLHGTIHVASEPGKGSTFRLEFPAPNEDPVSEPAAMAQQW